MLALFAATATLTLLSTAAIADHAVEAPTTETQPAPVDDSAPIWMWFIPPVGLVLGLTLGARLRSRHDRTRPKT